MVDATSSQTNGTRDEHARDIANNDPTKRESKPAVALRALFLIAAVVAAIAVAVASYLVVTHREAPRGVDGVAPTQPGTSSPR